MRTERILLQKHKHQYQMYVELTYLKLAYTTFKETGRYKRPVGFNCHLSSKP